MQDCWSDCELPERGLVSVRWCPEHEQWVVFAWAKADGDSPYVEVHPMWQAPRIVADDEHTDGTLLMLLTAVRRVTRRLSDERRSGQMTLFDA